MNQAHYLDLGYEPRYVVTEPYYLIDGFLCVDIYDNSLPKSNNVDYQIISRIRFYNKDQADNFTADMTEVVNEWDCEDYYDQDDPYRDYANTELLAMKGRHSCGT